LGEGGAMSGEKSDEETFIEEVGLRDWMAGMALQGIIASPRSHINGQAFISHGEIAKIAYEYADSMLKARQPEGGTK
jgi:hypothetical protein